MGLLDFLSNLGGGTQGAGDPNGGILAGIGGFARNNTNALTGLGTGLLSGPNWTTGIAAAGPAFQQGHQEDLRNQIFQNSMRANAAVINNMNLDPALKQAALANPQISQQIIAQKFAQPHYSFSQPNAEGTVLSQNDLTGDTNVAYKGQPHLVYNVVNGRLVASSPTSPQSADATPANLPQGYRWATDAERQQAHVDKNVPMAFGPDGKPMLLGPSTVVNSIQNQEGQFSGEAGKFQAGVFGELWKDGTQAQTDLGKVNFLADQLSKLPGGLLGNAQSFAVSHGFKVGPHPDAVEAANAIIQGLIPNQRQGMPGAVSDADREMFKGAIANIGNTPQGNALILATMRNLAQRRVQIAQISGAALNKQITPAEATARIQALGDPFADLRTAVSGQGQTQANKTVGSSPYAEGTRLNGPDGHTYVVTNGQPVLEQ